MTSEDVADCKWPWAHQIWWRYLKQCLCYVMAIFLFSKWRPATILNFDTGQKWCYGTLRTVHVYHHTPNLVTISQMAAGNGRFEPSVVAVRRAVRPGRWAKCTKIKETRKPSCRWQTRATLAKSSHGLRKSSGVGSCIARLPIDSLPMVSYYVLYSNCL